MQQGALVTEAALRNTSLVAAAVESNLFRKLQRDVVRLGCREANQAAWGWLALLGRCGLEQAAQTCIGFIKVYGLEGPAEEVVGAVQPRHLHAVLAALFAERGGRGLGEGGAGKGAAAAGSGRGEVPLGMDDAIWRRLHLS